MNNPHIYKIEHLAPLTMQREALHEHACRFAEKHFADMGHAPVMWILAIGTKLVWVRTPWDDDEEKDYFCAAMREMIQDTAAHAYAFVAEAWVAIETPGDEWFAARVAGDPVAPRNRPESQRDDVLMITSHGEDGSAGMTRYLVNVKHRSGLNYLGPRIDEDPKEMTAMSGRTWNVAGWKKA